MPDLTGERKLLLFSVGPVVCCADSLSIHRIIPPPKHLVHLPGRSHRPLIFRHETRLVSVLDVRSLFGLTPEASGQLQEKLIIAEIEGALFGFWVDEVQTIISEQEGNWRLLPTVVPRSFFDAAFNYREKLALHMDFAKLIHAEPISWVHASGLYDLNEVDIPSDTSKTEENIALDQKVTVPEAPTPTPRPSTPAIPPVPMVPFKPSARPKKSEPVRPAHDSKRPAAVLEQKRPVARPEHRAYSQVQKRASKTGPAYSPEPDRSLPRAPADMTKTDSPRLSYETSDDNYPTMQLIMWLVVGVISIALVFHFLWPSSTSRPEKADQYADKTPARKMPIRSTVSEAEVKQPLPAAITETGIQDAEEKEIEVLAEPVELDYGPASEIIEPPAVVTEEPPGPHAAIEREGNMVTIILSEGEIQDDGALTLMSDLKEQDIEIETPGEEPPEVAGTEEVSTEVESPPDQDLKPEEDNVGLAKTGLTSAPPEESLEIEIVSREPKIPAISQTSREIIHVVVSGDTLWHIARRYIHDPFRYPELARLSNIKNPDLIYPGDKVRIVIIRH